MSAPGRSCPLAYRYGPAAVAECPVKSVETLYVIGGLYGNLSALAAIKAMAAKECGRITLCFNGDFNWFNVDDEGFVVTNLSVLEHDAIQGNVEAELLTPGGTNDCGCAYPDTVDSGIVERSNAIHARLKATALRYPTILDSLRRLPMVRRYRVGQCLVGVVHGDAESLAGWRFDVDSLDNLDYRPWIDDAFTKARVDVFASTHTCLPVLRRFDVQGDRKVVINNGASGMPNFAGRQAGLITRIGIRPSLHEPLYGERIGDAFIDALEVPYDRAAWETAFLSNWPVHSPAHVSYFNRIVHGPAYQLHRADHRQLSISHPV